MTTEWTLDILEQAGLTARKERIEERAREYVAENPQLTITQARKLASHLISDSEQDDRDEQAEFDEFVRRGY